MTGSNFPSFFQCIPYPHLDTQPYTVNISGGYRVAQLFHPQL